MSLPDAEFLIRELPNLLVLPYPAVQELRVELRKRIPQILNDMRLSYWREFIYLYHMEDFLKLLLKYKE